MDSMNSFKELCMSKIVNDSSYGMFPRYHIRYDIHPDFLRKLFEDEATLEEFAEQLKRDVLYKLGKMADLDAYCKNDEKIIKEALERIAKGERYEQNIY